MPLPNAQRIDPLVQTSWSGGMITTLPPEELPMDAAVDILNFEFDSIGNLQTREAALSSFNIGIANQNISSLFRAKYSNSATFILLTSGTSLFKVNEDGTGLTNITGALSLPNAERWQWVMFNDFAIGTPTSPLDSKFVFNLPVKVNSAGVASVLANVPASIGCLEVWNSRLWVASQNTVYGSAINAPEDWTVDDDAGSIQIPVDFNDGDFIVALKQFRGNLYVYKRKKINVISAISAPATIPSNLRVDLYTNRLGCAAIDTIKDILDDQVFLSDSGVISLSLAPLGETNSFILSRNLEELRILNLLDILTTGYNNDFIASLVIESREQYWISIPASISSTGSDVVYVMDYSDIQQKDEKGLPKVRWCRFTGNVCGSAFTERIVGGLSSYFIAQRPVVAVNTPVLAYSPIGTSLNFESSNVATKRVLTRAFYSNSPLMRTIWHRVGMSYLKLTGTVTMTLNYYFNSILGASAGSYNITETAHAALSHITFWRRIKNNIKGRKANLVQLEITTNAANCGFTLKAVELDTTALNHRRARNS